LAAHQKNSNGAEANTAHIYVYIGANFNNSTYTDSSFHLEDDRGFCSVD
jgi:hypothetical protein